MLQRFTVPVLMLTLAIPSLARSRIKLASVPSEYTPTAGNGVSEPVLMANFSFEVNQETSRARIVVDYMYPDQLVFGIGGAGPQPSYVQLPGLTYDPSAKAVVYEASGKKTVCANLHSGRFLFWQRTIIEPTGACIVSARIADHAEDDGWSIRKFRAIDTFFEVR
jgi:hypothetical protein